MPENTVDVVLRDTDKALQIDYPNGRQEFLWKAKDGAHAGQLMSMMDGRRPAVPADRPSARQVVEQYGAVVIDREEVD